MPAFQRNSPPGVALVEDPRAEWLTRWILGVIFIYSSWHKIMDPEAFAKILLQYQLLPDSSINLLAVFVPFVQLTAGAALVLGVYPRSAALLCVLMLLVFTVTLAVNVLRGHTFDCGCFSLESNGNGMSPKVSIVRNLLLLSMGIYLAWFPGRRPACLKPTGGILSRPGRSGG